MRKPLVFIALLAFVLSASLAQAQVTKETVPGITNFARVESTIACAGATTPASMADVKRLGFAAVVNLREASEPGADVDKEAAAAKAAGLNYVHLPLKGSAPDPAVVDQFLKAVTEPANQPVFVHCASGNRAAAMWLIKRVQVDRWDFDRAATEAADLGLTSGALKTFAREYIDSHRH